MDKSLSKPFTMCALIYWEGHEKGGRQVVMDLASHGELLKLCIVDRKELVWAINREERKLTFFGKVPGTKLEKRRNFGMQNNK